MIDPTEIRKLKWNVPIIHVPEALEGFVMGFKSSMDTLSIFHGALLLVEFPASQRSIHTGLAEAWHESVSAYNPEYDAAFCDR